MLSSIPIKRSRIALPLHNAGIHVTNFMQPEIGSENTSAAAGRFRYSILTLCIIVVIFTMSVLLGYETWLFYTMRSRFVIPEVFGISQAEGTIRHARWITACRLKEFSWEPPERLAEFENVGEPVALDEVTGTTLKAALLDRDSYELHLGK